MLDAKDSRENEDLSNQSRRSVVRRGSRGLRRRRAGRRGGERDGEGVQDGQTKSLALYKPLSPPPPPPPRGIPVHILVLRIRLNPNGNTFVFSSLIILLL